MGQTNSAARTPGMIDADGVAQRTLLSVRTIRSMDAAGRLPAPIRLSRKSVRWRTAEIDRWIELGCPDRKAWEKLRAS
jgi:predicted DNA-binding transcriptional regulator AlpA